MSLKFVSKGTIDQLVLALVMVWCLKGDKASRIGPDNGLVHEIRQAIGIDSFGAL